MIEKIILRCVQGAGVLCIVSAAGHQIGSKADGANPDASLILVILGAALIALGELAIRGDESR